MWITSGKIRYDFVGVKKMERIFLKMTEYKNKEITRSEFLRAITYYSCKNIKKDMSVYK